ncbi:MAG TPA: sugar ABC transporter substrate-binding protein [Spirochaetes bacterium]|nr:sugar ABC transporter substrate-binding protein [Spirochaetota bacterium]
MKKRIIFLVIVVVVFSLVFISGGKKEKKAPVEKPVEKTVETVAPSAEHSNLDEFTYIQRAGTKTDLTEYYAEYEVDSRSVITAMGGVVSVDGLPDKLPTPNEKYTIGLALYYTVDEVGAFVLEGTEKAAQEMGIKLLVNDANYTQSTQDQAIEQWILQGVDGVIFYPADFNACKPILEKLKEAGIPVMAGNPPLIGEVNSVMTIDNVEIGRKSADFIVDSLKAKGKVEGTVVFQTLPFLHPNAETREAGFREVLGKHPGIKIIELTGISPEDHYTALEGAMQANPDMVAAWGLYSSAVIGMSNARKAAKRDDIILVGVDNDRPILAGIYKGEITGSVGYNAYNHAYWTLSNIVNILNGAEVPGQIIGPIEVIEKHNVSDLFEMYYGGRTLADYMAGK